MASLSKWLTSKKFKATKKARSSGSKVQATLRLLKLQVLRHLTHFTKPVEPKKTAIYKNRSAASLHILLYLLPGAGATTIVAFNLTSMFVGTVQINVLTALQFAAKLLEILVQASIAATVLAIVRLWAFGTNGLPFGGLIAPYRTQDISSLWSLELWACLTAPSLKLRRKVLLGLILTTAIILASIVGPASAILIIPRPTQHLVSKQLGIREPVDDLYPRTIKLQPNGTIRAEYSFNQTSYQATNGILTTWPAPIVDSWGIRGVQLASIPFIQTWNPDYVATVPTVLSTRLPPTSRGGDAITAYSTQAYVHIDCWSSSYPNTEITDPNHQYIDFGPSKTYLKDLITFDMVMSNYTRPPNNTTIAVHHVPPSNSTLGRSYVWSNLPPDCSNDSLAMVVSWADIKYDSLDWQKQTNVTSQLACTIDAYWATAATNATSNAVRHNEIPASSTEDPKAALERLKDKVLTSMSPEWAKRVVTSAVELIYIDTNPDPYFVAYQLQTSQLALAMSSIPPWDGFPSVFSRTYTPSQEETSMNTHQYDALQKYISSHRLTDLYDQVAVYAANTGWTDPESLAQIRWAVYSNGYGYNTSPITVKLSLAVVILYLALVGTYLIWTVGTGYAATSWDSVAELVALALNSQRPNALENTSVGIDTLETFRQPVNIRVNQEDSLEVVFKEAVSTATFTTVVVNKRY